MASDRFNCYSCGLPGHFARDCPQGPGCYSCGQSGHIARECPSETSSTTDTTPSPATNATKTLSLFTGNSTASSGAMNGTKTTSLFGGNSSASSSTISAAKTSSLFGGNTGAPSTTPSVANTSSLSGGGLSIPPGATNTMKASSLFGGGSSTASSTISVTKTSSLPGGNSTAPSATSSATNMSTLFGGSSSTPSTPSGATNGTKKLTLFGGGSGSPSSATNGTKTSTLFGGGSSAPFSFGAPASTAFGGNAGECQGTASVLFRPFVEKESNPTINQWNSFQCISLMTSHRKFSPEELRLADYLYGRRYGSGTTTPSSFPSNNTPATFATSPFIYNGTPGNLNVKPTTSSVATRTPTASPGCPFVFPCASTVTSKTSAVASVTAISAAKPDSDVPPAKKRKVQEMDFSDPKQEFVTIIVDKEDIKESFCVHRTLICQFSPFFKAAFESLFREGLTQTMRMEDVDTKVFGVLVNWLYTKELNYTGVSKFMVVDRTLEKVLGKARFSFVQHLVGTSHEVAKQADEEDLRELALLAMIWNLADRCLIPRLQNEAMKILRNKFTRPNKVIELAWLGEYFFETKETTPLKRLIVKRLLLSADNSELLKWMECESSVTKALCIDLMKELAKTHVAFHFTSLETLIPKAEELFVFEASE